MRASETTALRAAVLLPATLLGLFSCSRPDNEASLTSLAQFPVRTESRKTPEAESLFDALDAEEDRFFGEAVAEELEGRLHTLADALREKREEEVADLLAGDFRANPPPPLTTSPVAAPQGLRVARHRYSDVLSLDRLKFSRALLDSIGDYDVFDALELKIVGVAAERETAHTEVLLDISGRNPAGEVLGRRVLWEVDWSRRDGEWTMKLLRARGGSEASAGKPFFTDVSASALGANPSYWEQMRLGIDHFRETMDAAGGIGVYGHHGVAVGDVDGDGLEDLFVAQPSGLPNRLYKNRGDGSFVDISKEAGVDHLDRTSMGLFADHDNDGDQDLFIIVQNRGPVLLVNDGKGVFAPSALARFDRKDRVKATFASASLADYDGDGYLDLYVCSYRYFDHEGEDTQLALPYPYHDATNGPPNALFRNRGDGTFEDATAAAGLEEGNDRFSFASSWGDFNRDGHPDLYVANDFGRNNLYQNLGNGRFREVARTAGVEDIGAGMSVAWADYDLDGWDDLYVGNMWSSAGQRLTSQSGFQSRGVLKSYMRHAKGNSLFRNLGNGRFEDVSESAGVELGRWAWSSDFFDADHDGDQDIYVANGFITNTSTKDL